MGIIKVGCLEKVSPNQFKKDLSICVGYSPMCKPEEYHSNRGCPTRATSGSAGYDFCSPVDALILPKESIVIPTGIRAFIEDGWFLSCYIRSSLGIKHGIRLANIVGIIDSDYYISSNEGHILLKLTNDSDVIFTLHQGDAFAQGIFLPYGIAYNDSATGTRNGGFGSTGR